MRSIVNINEELVAVPNNNDPKIILELEIKIYKNHKEMKRPII